MDDEKNLETLESTSLPDAGLENSENNEMVKYIPARSFKNANGRARMFERGPKRMSERKEAGIELSNARFQQQPLTARMNGLEYIKDQNGENVLAPVVTNWRDWKIIIPREEFIAPSMVYGNAPEEELIARRLQGSFGMEFDFIPEKLIRDEDTDRVYCVASRLRAMEVQKQKFWFAKNKKDNGEVEYFLKEGKKSDARIVHVMKGAVVVEIYGVESVIKAEEISYYRFNDARDMYKTGDRTEVQILTVNRNRKTREVSYTASIRRARKDPRIDAYGRFMLNGRYQGVVTMVDTSGNNYAFPFVFVRISDEKSMMDVFCWFPKGVTPQIGDRCTVDIVNKFPEKLYLTGRIHHLERSNNRR